jgi:hypothetical protein
MASPTAAKSGVRAPVANGDATLRVHAQFGGHVHRKVALAQLVELLGHLPAVAAVNQLQTRSASTIEPEAII